MYRRFLMIALVSVLGLVACGETVNLVDPPVQFDRPATGGDGGTQTPSLTLGIFSEQFFTPLEDDSVLPIIAGFQGGDWVMPALRTEVITGVVLADARVTLMETGEVVGVLDDAQDRLQPTAEGSSENVGLPIPIRHAGDRAGDPIDDLYGQRARLELTVTDTQERSATTSKEVVLVED